MPTEGDKHAALVDLVDSTLSAVKSGPAVEDRFRATRTAQKSARDDLMGDPVYYCEVQREGYQVGGGDPSTGDAPYLPGHRYGIRLWHDYEDTDASKDQWDDLVEGSAGLLYTLRQEERITSSGNTYPLQQPQEVQEAVTRLSTRSGDPQAELAWYLEFSIIVTHKES